MTILPEIEIPGHAQAAIAAYPELGCTGQSLEVSPTWGIHSHVLNPSEETIGFLQDVLSEVMALFPSPFIHIGGDEAVTRQWRDSPKCQARVRELGLKSEGEVQAYLTRRIGEFLTAHGRRLVGWDEILEGDLAPEAVVMSWRGETGGLEAARAGHDVVMAPHQYTYLDFYQSEAREQEPLASPSLVTLEMIYHYDPVPSGLSPEQARHILGAQGQLWTEYMPTASQVEYMAFPRLSALAEVTWSPRNQRHYSRFLGRLRTHLERLDLIGVHYRPLQPSEAIRYVVYRVE